MERTSEPETTCYIRNHHRHGFRRDQWAKILGVVWVRPPVPAEARACFHVAFVDGIEDYFSVQDPDAEYEFYGRRWKV